MATESILIKDKNYTLHTHYQQDETLRAEFNRMTQQFWGFDFENYYQSGFWDDKCILYSLFDENRIVSHTTVSLFEQEERTLVQLGTVMTDENYQKQGLSRFLIERITADFMEKSDGMFLFANETVLDFYPRFNFFPVSEFESFQTGKNTELVQKFTRRKLNLDDNKDLKTFETLVETAVANSKFPTKNKGLSFFYGYAYPEMGYKDAAYFIEELNCAVIAMEEGGNLQIVEIFSSHEINLQDVVTTFADISFNEVTFGFTPKQEGFNSRIWREEDLQLFVSPELLSVFEQDRLKVAALSHT